MYQITVLNPSGGTVTTQTFSIKDVTIFFALHWAKIGQGYLDDNCIIKIEKIS